MADEPLFIDSGGFYALVSADSAAHANAVAIMEQSKRTRRRTITTDYILHETAALLRARGSNKQLRAFLLLTDASQALSIEWMTPKMETPTLFLTENGNRQDDSEITNLGPCLNASRCGCVYSRS